MPAAGSGRPRRWRNNPRPWQWTIAGRVTSYGEARRQIKGGGLRINDVTAEDDKMILKIGDLTPEGVIKLSVGRKRHVLLKPA